MIANVSSSLFGVDVIIARPPVANVGDIEVQNSSAILGILQMQTHHSIIRIIGHTPTSISCSCSTNNPTSIFKLHWDLCYNLLTPALIKSGHNSYPYLIRCIISCAPVYLCGAN